MKALFKYKLLFFLFLFPLLLFGQKGHKIKIDIDNFKGEKCYLAYHLGDKQYMKDTADFQDGTCLFTGAEKLKGGIYLVILPPDNRYFEIIVADDQHFDLKTDWKDPAGELKVKGSKENELFYEYIEYLSEKKKEVQEIQNEINEDTEEKEIVEIQNKMKAINEEVNQYQQKLIKENPGFFYSKILKALREPEVPEAPAGADTFFRYYYLKDHYFDNIDFSDERLLRTPVYHNRLKSFFDEMVIRHPDSINAAADQLLAKARSNKEIFKYTLIYLLNRYADSKIMGMDAVYVHLAENYYAKGDAFWLDEAELYRITQRGKALKPLLLGKNAPPLILKDTTGSPVSLYDVEAEYTILYFWDPDCGHCKKVTPRLKEVYEKFKSKGVEVYAASITHEEDKWKEYIIKNELSWINVADVAYRNPFRDIYDINSTPVIYLLDKDKKITAKKISADQLEEILENYLNEE